MKKIIIALALLGIVGTADAHWRGGCCYRGGWIAPALIGGVIGYELSRPYYAPLPVYIQPPVVVQQPQVIIQQPQIVQDAPLGYHWQWMIDPATNQQKAVLVPN